MLADIFRVNLRYDERNVRIHTPEARFVDDDLNAFARFRNEIARDVVRRRRDHEIDVVKRVRAKLFDGDLAPVKRDLFTDAALRRKELHLLIRELTLLKHTDNQRSNRARGAYDCYGIVHNLPSLRRSRPPVLFSTEFRAAGNQFETRPAFLLF